MDLLKGAQKCHDNQLVLTQRESTQYQKKQKTKQSLKKAKKAKIKTTTKSKWGEKTEKQAYWQNKKGIDPIRRSNEQLAKKQSKARRMIPGKKACE